MVGAGASGAARAGWLDWFLQKQEDRQDQQDSMIATQTLSYNSTAGSYLAGQFAQSQQDWKTASLYLDRVMTRDPGNMDIQQRSMVLAMESGDVNRAVALARKVVDGDPKNILGLLFIGTDQVSRQEYSAAARTLSKMPDNGVSDFIRPILIAWAEAADGKLNEQDLINNSPLHAYHALLIADYLGKIAQPEKYLANILAGGETDAHMLEMVADVMARQGKPDLAKKIYGTLIDKNAETGNFASRITALESKRDNPVEAVGERIKTPAEGIAEAFYDVARILYQEDSNDSALVFIRMSQHLNPSFEGAKLLMARMMIRNDHLDDAIALYKAIDPKSPEYWDAQHSAAELLEEQGKLDAAVSYLEELYKANGDVTSLIQIGDTYRRAEDYTKAIQAYDRAADAIGKDIPDKYWNLLYVRGMSYERAGNMEKAEADLQQALKFRPNHPYLLNYLGYSWAEQGKKLDESLTMVEKAATLRPDDGYIIDSLGWVYYKKGDYKEAAAQLEKAIELVPFDPTINDHLGDAYWQVGRKAEARFQWRRALSHSKDKELNATLEEKIKNGLAQIEPLSKAAMIEIQRPEAKDKDSVLKR